MWVKWELVCTSKDRGGLGVKNLGWFNESLLCKWAWRLLSEHSSLWVSVIRSKYGGLSRSLESVIGRRVWGKNWSSWWRDVVKLLGKSDWFWKGLLKNIGEGKSTSFWDDSWVEGGVNLKSRFPRLYSLESNKNFLVSDRLVVRDGVKSLIWNWRRNLFVWEEELVVDLVSIVNRLHVGVVAQDCWSWIHSPKRIYTTKDGYAQISLSHGEPSMMTVNWQKMVWLKTVPQKLNAYVWRVINNRIASLPNLLKRGVLYSGADVSCRLCNSQLVETMEHLFVSCEFAKDVWIKIHH